MPADNRYRMVGKAFYQPGNVIQAEKDKKGCCMNLAQTGLCPICGNHRSSKAHKKAGCSKKIQLANR